MSFKAVFQGVEITCDTPAELRTLLSEIASLKSAAPPKNGAGRAAAGAPAAVPGEARRSHHTGAGIADPTYVKQSWRVVRTLLDDKEHHAVGKLQISLARELDLKGEMIRRVLERLLQEQPCFIFVQKTSRGQSPYVRLTNLEAAEKFVAAQKAQHEKNVGADLQLKTGQS